MGRYFFVSPSATLHFVAFGFSRTFGAISMSCDPDATSGFEPLLPGNIKVNFGSISILYSSFNYFSLTLSISDDLEDLEAKLKQHGDKVAAFIVEPIQGEAGFVSFPSPFPSFFRLTLSIFF
jgi:ornithine--oxo-acid transaminase